MLRKKPLQLHRLLLASSRQTNISLGRLTQWNKRLSFFAFPSSMENSFWMTIIFLTSPLTIVSSSRCVFGMSIQIGRSFHPPLDSWRTLGTDSNSKHIFLTLVSIFCAFFFVWRDGCESGRNVFDDLLQEVRSVKLPIDPSFSFFPLR